MWSFIKRFLAGPPAPEDPLREIVRFDDAGFTRTSALARAMGLREFWPWSDIHEFGFLFTQAIYPDPWFGDYMESLWFIRVPSDGGGLMLLDFDQTVLDIERLPPALLRNLPGLDMDVLRSGLATAGRGLRHYDGEGEWVAWRRAGAPPGEQAVTPGPGPA
ncbi:hypothetical protein ACFWP0_17475 [Achromobacter sp. NPDC058515]|uniref:hypothetical protein n=1 Tax=Achromobacter sp. NPDC058515 TaxID=3346533 RepID=UPI0036623E68